jgi:putative spermidine/putrescine transport system ATP-binding protein
MTQAPASLSITLQACAKTFDDGTRVLEPLDLSIAAGETLVLLGPSGCGKTTTLRIVAGLERPDAGGRVLFDGDDVTALDIAQRNVGMVFQSYALFPNMSVAENVGYGLRVRRTPAAERTARVREMLAMMRIEALADRKVDQLSGGQRQRVALARALAVRPRALLLDEPLTALDAKLREALRTEISALLRRLHITSVYVTHDQAEAMALGDRIVVMSHGRVEQIGSPREIYQRPASRFVADFIGAMNRLPGRMLAGAFHCSGGSIAWPQGPERAQEILFRPEHVRIAESEAVADLRGTVSATFFLGDRSRVLVDIGDDRTVTLEGAMRRPLRPGERLGLRIDAQDLLTF